MDEVQSDINFNMRSILLDWLVEVAEEYNLQTQTLFLSVAYVDRFLSKVPVDRSKLQLVGVTAMLLAAKYWEIYPPSIEDFVYISDNTYSRDHVVSMESSMLSVLKFGLTVPTVWDFSKRFGKIGNLDTRTEELVEYLLELFMQDSQFLQYRPSQISCAAIFLALWNTHQVPWNAALQTATGYRADELQLPIRDMQQNLVKAWQAGQQDPTSAGASSLKAVREKFSSTKRREVAKIRPRAA
jgi:hypothetical protein